MQIPSPEPRLTADEYLGAAPDAFGDIEVVDGFVVHNMAQSEVHDLVVLRLAAALEGARPAGGPCFRVSSHVGARFADAASSRTGHRLNVRYPDIMVRDCDPYDVNTVRDRIQLLVEVSSEATFEADTTVKRVLYAAAGIPATSSFTSTRTGRGSVRSKSTGLTGRAAGTWSRPCTAARLSWTTRSA